MDEERVENPEGGGAAIHCFILTERIVEVAYAHPKYGDITLLVGGETFVLGNKETEGRRKGEDEQNEQRGPGSNVENQEANSDDEEGLVRKIAPLSIGFTVMSANFVGASVSGAR